MTTDKQSNRFKILAALDENEFIYEVEKYYEEERARGRKQKTPESIDGVVVRLRNLIADSENDNGSGFYGRESVSIYETYGADSTRGLFEQIVNSRGLINGRSNRVITFNSVKRTAEQKLTAENEKLKADIQSLHEL